MTRTTRRVFLGGFAASLGLATLSGCVTRGRPAGQTASAAVSASPGAGEARIFFYREDFAFLGAIEPEIVVNGKRVGTSRVGEAFFRDAAPGRYQVYSSHNPDYIVEFWVAAGEEAFVKVEPRLQGLNTKLTTVLMDPTLAEQELEELTLIEPSVS